MTSSSLKRFLNNGTKKGSKMMVPIKVPQRWYQKRFQKFLNDGTKKGSTMMVLTQFENVPQ